VHHLIQKNERKKATNSSSKSHLQLVDCISIVPFFFEKKTFFILSAVVIIFVVYSEKDIIRKDGFWYIQFLFDKYSLYGEDDDNSLDASIQLHTRAIITIR
jgi:hypothetical protein